MKILPLPLPLALPAPSWHTDNNSNRDHAPAIFALLREATDRQILELKDLHERFIESLATQKMVKRPEGWVWQTCWGPTRYLASRESSDLRDAADSVRYWIGSAIESRFRAAIEKRENAARQAARTKARKRSARALDETVSRPFAPIRRAA